MEIKYLYSVTSNLWCLIIIDGFCLICSSMSPYKPPSRSILIVTFEIFLKSSQLPFFFSGSLPLLSFFSPVSFLSLLCFLSSSPCRPLSQSQAIPCLSRGGGGQGVLRINLFLSIFQKRGRGFCHSAAGSKSVRPQRQSSANVL